MPESRTDLAEFACRALAATYPDEPVVITAADGTVTRSVQTSFADWLSVCLVVHDGCVTIGAGPSGPRLSRTIAFPEDSAEMLGDSTPFAAALMAEFDTVMRDQQQRRASLRGEV